MLALNYVSTLAMTFEIEPALQTSYYKSHRVLKMLPAGLVERFKVPGA